MSASVLPQQAFRQDKADTGGRIVLEMRSIRPFVSGLPAAALALALLAPTVAALHELPATVTLYPAPRIEAKPLDETIRHVLQDAVDAATAPLRPPDPAPEPAAPSGAATPAEQETGAAPSLLPWALAALALLALAAAAAGWLRARRARARRREEARLRQELALCRQCAEGAVQRAVRLADANGRLRAQLAQKGAAEAPAAGAPHSPKPA